MQWNIFLEVKGHLGHLDIFIGSRRPPGYIYKCQVSWSRAQSFLKHFWFGNHLENILHWIQPLGKYFTLNSTIGKIFEIQFIHFLFLQEPSQAKSSMVGSFLYLYFLWHVWHAWNLYQRTWPVRYGRGFKTNYLYVISFHLIWQLYQRTWPVKYGRKLSECTRVAKSMNPDTFNDIFYWGNIYCV